MIDHSRYAGHTPGPWGHAWFLGKYSIYPPGLEYDDKKVSDIDVALAADAPLLLAENALLREIVERQEELLSDFKHYAGRGALNDMEEIAKLKERLNQ